MKPSCKQPVIQLMGDDFPTKEPSPKAQGIAYTAYRQVYVTENHRTLEFYF